MNSQLHALTGCSAAVDCQANLNASMANHGMLLACAIFLLIGIFAHLRCGAEQQVVMPPVTKRSLIAIAVLTVVAAALVGGLLGGLLDARSHARGDVHSTTGDHNDVVDVFVPVYTCANRSDLGDMLLLQERRTVAGQLNLSVHAPCNESQTIHRPEIWISVRTWFG